MSDDLVYNLLFGDAAKRLREPPHYEEIVDGKFRVVRGPFTFETPVRIIGPLDFYLGELGDA